MAEAVLVVLLVGEELRGVQVDFIISVYCCQNPQGAALQGCMGTSGRGGTIPKHQTRDSYSFLRLIADPLCPYHCSFTLLIFPFPPKRRGMAGPAPTAPTCPSLALLRGFLNGKEMHKPNMHTMGFMAAVIWQE